MGDWDQKILSAADKISKGIEKGADYISNLKKPDEPLNFQYPQNTNAERNVKHCPSCGYAIGSLDLFCPSCGSPMEDANASSAAQQLAYNLALIDNQKEGIVSNFIRTHQDKISNKAVQKAQMIKSFPVPNTKKDILEFIHMASSNINTSILLGDTAGSSLDADALKSEKLISEAWLEKMESVYQKGKTLFAGDSDFAKIESIYSFKKREIETYRENLRKKEKKSHTITVILVIILMAGIATAVFFGIRGERQAKVTKNNNLESIVVEIRQDIADGNYDAALLKTNKVRLKDGDSAEEEAKWDREREMLVKEIEEARNK